MRITNNQAGFSRRDSTGSPAWEDYIGKTPRLQSVACQPPDLPSSLQHNNENDFIFLAQKSLILTIVFMLMYEIDYILALLVLTHKDSADAGVSPAAYQLFPLGQHAPAFP